MKNYLFALSILFSIQLIPTEFVKAGEADELFSLCSRFPYNSKCKGYEAPISLDNRLGEEAKCLIDIQEDIEDCKIDIKNTSLNIYLETGDKLDVLDGDKETQELTVPLSDIESFTYSEKKKVDVGRVIAFGVWGLLSKKKTATFNFRLKPQETTEESQFLKQIVFVTQRSNGRDMRQSIEEKTGLVPEVFLDID